MKNTILVLIAALILSGCSQKWKQSMCRKWDVCQTVKDSTVVTIRDTVYKVQMPVNYDDSSNFMLYLECNEANNVIATQAKIWQGKYSELKYKFDKGLLTVTNYVEIRDTVTKYIQVKDTSVSTFQQQQPIIKNELKTWQAFLLGSGIGFWLGIIIYLLYRLVKAILSKYTGGFSFLSKRR